MVNSFYSEDELTQFRFKSIGKNVLISRKASLYGSEQMQIGSNVRIDDFSILSGNITIHNFIHIAAFCGLFGGGCDAGIEMMDFSGLSSKVSVYAISDDYSGKVLTNAVVPEKFKNIQKGKVVLEKHAIVGCGSVILPSVKMHIGSALGSMSLLTKSTNEWTIYMGIPAKSIKERKKDLLLLETKMLAELSMS